MAGLKPNEEVIAGTAAIAAVITIFQMEAPNLADVRASMPHNSNVHSSIRNAAITSAAVVSGIALLAKSPTVYTMGGLTIAFLAWKGYSANATHPVTGKLTVPGQYGTPQQSGSGGTGPA